MSKTIRMAKLSAKGGFSLFLGVSLSTIISSVGVFLVAWLLTEDKYGLYTIALISPALMGLFRDWGINSAMIKHLAQYRSENRTSEMRNVLASGLLFVSALGVLLSIISFLIAGPLAANVWHRPEAKTIIEVASVIILAESLLIASQSAFTGFEKLEFYSLTLICQSSFKTLLAPLFVFLGYSTLGAVLGHTIAFIVTSTVAIILLYLIFYKRIHGTESGGSGLGETLKTMLRYGLPVSISNILNGFLAQFYSFMMAIYCSNLMIGNLSVAVNFAVLITFFTTPITIVLFPAFSKLDSEKEMGTLRIMFQSSVKYAALLTIPATVGIMALSKPLVSTLFGSKYSYAPIFLTLYAVNYLYAGLGKLSLENFLNGQGKTKVTMKLTLIALGFGLPLSLVLIPRFEIIGLIVTSLVAGIPGLAVGLWWVKRHFGVTIDWASSTRIFMASAAAGAITYIAISQLSSPDWIELVLGGTIFLAIYLVVAPLMRAVDKSDVNTLREMLSDLGPFSRLFDLPLNIIEKLLTFFAL